MKILFVHQNFPGQFLHLAPALAARGHECRAITDSGNARQSPIQTWRYKHAAEKVDPAATRLGRNYTTMSDRGVTVARAALRVLVDEGLTERSATLGAAFLARLRTLRSPHVKEFRGRGLLIGIELTSRARPFCEALAQEGVLCKETHDTVLRIAPPLVITQDELDWAFTRIARVLGAE